MKNLLIRIISGVIFVGLTIGSILISNFTFAAVFTIFVAYTLYEFYRMLDRGGIKVQKIPGLVIAIYIFVSFFLYDKNYVGPGVFLGLIPLLIFVPAYELFRKKNNATINIATTLFGVVYIALPFSVLNFICTPYTDQPALYKPEILLGFFIILWANDSGAYLFGNLLGKNKMIERISPKKTWEGAIGGAILATLITIFMFRAFDFLNLFHAIGISLVTVISGTFGDLSESLLKRNFMVKDSGELMPGHGGLLDRFDSMLFAAPLFYTYISFALN